MFAHERRQLTQRGRAHPVRIADQHHGRVDRNGDIGKILRQIPRQTGHGGGLGRIGIAGNAQGIAIGLCILEQIKREHATAPGPILDYHRLMHLSRQPLTDHTRGQISRTTGGKRHDHANGTIRIVAKRARRAACIGRIGPARFDQCDCNGKPEERAEPPATQPHAPTSLSRSFGCIRS